MLNFLRVISCSLGCLSGIGGSSRDDTWEVMTSTPVGSRSFKILLRSNWKMVISAPYFILVNCKEPLKNLSQPSGNWQCILFNNDLKVVWSVNLQLVECDFTVWVHNMKSTHKQCFSSIDFPDSESNPKAVFSHWLLSSMQCCFKQLGNCAPPPLFQH